MKSSYLALAALLALVPVAGATFAATDTTGATTAASDNPGAASAASDNPGDRHRHWSPEDRAAFLDARIAALKAGLELNADQEKNWPALESALREVAKDRAARFAAWQEHRGEARDTDPVDRLTRASDRLSARAADLSKLAAAAKPLYDSLDDAQKRRFAMLFKVGGHRHWRQWRHEG